MNLCLSEKIFISSSFLKDFFFFFSGYTVLCRPFLPLGGFLGNLSGYLSSLLFFFFF